MDCYKKKFIRDEADDILERYVSFYDSVWQFIPQSDFAVFIRFYLRVICSYSFTSILVLMQQLQYSVA